MTWPYSLLPDNALLDILSDMAASRLNVNEQSAMDDQNEGMGDAGEWREFALRRLLRELAAKAGRAEAVEALGVNYKSLARRTILRWLRRALILRVWWRDSAALVRDVRPDHPAWLTVTLEGV